VTELVRARGVTKTYGRKRALDGFDLSIGEGRIVGLIGPNGAGKTTALKAVLGLTSYQGELSVLGLDPVRQRQRLMQDVCFIADVAVLPRWLRVDQALAYVETVHPRFRRERAEEFLARTDIPRRAKVKALSKGMITQLHLALIMAIDARLLVLDEPTLGLDILFRKAFYTTLLNDYFDESRTILVTTHQVEEIEHILTDVVFIDHGRAVLCEAMDALGERYSQLISRREHAEAARALGPLSEEQSFGRHVFIFEDQPRERLAELGELRTPPISDLFVAKVGGGTRA
jgi:ABC-2 type transport system ATP-binding protein